MRAASPSAARSRRSRRATTSRSRCTARLAIALAACLQLDAVSYNAFIQEQSLGIHYKGNDLLDYLRNPEVFRYETASSRSRRARGLGIDVNEEKVREMAKTGHRWRNPVWRHEDGSVAEW